MKPILVLYATREGHTQRVAERFAAALRDAGAQASVANVRDAPEPLTAEALRAIVLAGSVHAGSVERELVRFVRRARPLLDRVPNALLAVSLSQAGVQRQDATPEEHARFVADVAKLDRRFAADTGWQPQRVHHVAGALLYTRYNWLVRQVMRRIARLSGGSTDTSRDHDYTDWADLEAFARRFAAEAGEGRDLPSR